MRIFVTGCAGFIGFHISKKLIEDGNKVIGIDNINKYYDQKLKKSRLKILKELSKKNKKNFLFIKGDITNKNLIKKIFLKTKFNKVIHLAAQAGVRYSLKNPRLYLNTNIKGFFNVLDESRKNKIKQFIYASTSSVYGGNTKIPFKEIHPADHPLQLYAVTKKSNELMAHAYSSLYGLPTIGLRFFTVYGPWGRPDMALFDFTRRILSGKKINLFNHGRHSRDFTYIDDIVQGIFKIIKSKKLKRKKQLKNQQDISESFAPYQILNIGKGKNVSLMKFIKAIEKATLKKAKIKKLPFQPGDIKDTFADTSKIKKYYKYLPQTDFELGVNNFVNWYKNFYKIKNS